MFVVCEVSRFQQHHERTIIVRSEAVIESFVSRRGALLLQGAAHQLNALFHYPDDRSGGNDLGIVTLYVHLSI